MFDLITGNIERPLRERSPLSKLVAAVLHVFVVSVQYCVLATPEPLPSPGVSATV